MDFLKTIEKANKYFNKGDFTSAFLCYNELLREEPNMSAILYLTGICKYNLKENLEAIKYFDRMIENSPNDYRGYYSKGLCLFSECEFSASLYYFTKADELIQDNVDILFMISCSLLFLNNPDSKEYLNLALNIDKKRTKELLSQFYEKFFKENDYISLEEKVKFQEKIDNLGK